MENYDQIDTELYELLVSFNDSDTISSSTSCDNVSSSSHSQLTTKKRRSRRKYEVPKVFKCDIRWSYTTMFVNVLSTFDVYLVYSFFATYSLPTLRHSNRLQNRVIDSGMSSLNLINLVKLWYIITCTSPDAVYSMNNPQIRNNIDGTSEISLCLTIEGNYFYEKPQIEDVDESETIPLDILHSHKRKLQQFNDQSKGKHKTLGKNGLRLPNYVHDDRVHVNNDEDLNFLQKLENLSLSSFLPEPVHKVATGMFYMHLDSNKRITTTEFVSYGAVATPIIRSEVM